MTDFTETFWLTLVATGAGIIGLVIKKMAASKCDTIEMCGLKIHRRVDLESNEENDEAKSTTTQIQTARI